MRRDSSRVRLSPLQLGVGIALFLIFMVACVLMYRIYRNQVHQQFLASLPHVECTRQLVIGMTPAEMKQAMKVVRERELDLLELYRSSTDRRPTLAWMLIERESEPYIEFVRQNPELPDECEARLWQTRLRRRLPNGEPDRSTSDRYRGMLLELILSSPQATSRLASARWYQAQGEEAEARLLYENLLSDVRTSEAGEAAVGLLTISPGHEDAQNVIMNILETEEPFFAAGATALVRQYQSEADLWSGLDRANGKSLNDLDRREFVEALRHRIELSRR